MEDNIETESRSSLRSPSPSPSISVTPAASTCPSPDRTFSTVSSVSNYSGNSGDNRYSMISSASTASRRRGYIRTHGAEFAESAKNRESVMCLGSIAHLQYYFARTGLLDGKGGRGMRPGKKGQKEVPKVMLTPEDEQDGQQGPQFGENLVDSPDEEFADSDDGAVFDDDDEVMLPPTVSTYSVKPHNVPPPPDLQALRKDLVEALDKASLSVQASANDAQARRNSKSSQTTLAPPPEGTPAASASGQDPSANSTTKPMGWYEVQGMQILDVVTLAIRAARIYYTAHERPDRLHSIKSENTLREELFAVLDVLKGWAQRNFAGGLRNDERAAILDWMSGVLMILDEERRLEELEAQERAGWTWMHGDWTGREREREELFLQTLMKGAGPPLPPWTPPDDGPLPTPMLERLRDGRDLVRMHNQAVRKSRRFFGEIKRFHEDIAKPYRRAENIRYWKKAAELRWETKLEMDVMGVVYGTSDDAWRQFDAALLAWCKGVREEMTRDWRDDPKASAAHDSASVTPEADGLAGGV
ncbi:hypothetical protein VTN77DRAFT_6559 [Rasamsonia byssochlamydoides]|uniref:uncharacterized protein n=1 Tax=Rasamsonia byssochlamydoides TaxID=89139 RepID=UPI0037427B25